MAITAKMVSELREMTGAAMMDCKKALEASGGNIEEAVDHLRKQGLKSAAKKASRETSEGRVFAVQADGMQRGHLVGVACETDFLSSSDRFKAFIERLRSAVEAGDPTGVEDGERPFLSQPMEDAENVGEAIKATVGEFGENLRVQALVRLENVEGRIGTYIHHDNKKGAIVSVTTGADADKAGEALTALCQHALVFAPAYCSRDDVPAEDVERERKVIAESDEVKSKPENIRDKIVDGKLKRFYAEKVFSDQAWMLDDKITVGQYLEKELGAGSRIETFSVVKLG